MWDSPKANDESNESATGERTPFPLDTESDRVDQPESIVSPSLGFLDSSGPDINAGSTGSMISPPARVERETLFGAPASVSRSPQSTSLSPLPPTAMPPAPTTSAFPSSSAPAPAPRPASVTAPPFTSRVGASSTATIDRPTAIGAPRPSSTTGLTARTSTTFGTPGTPTPSLQEAAPKRRTWPFLLLALLTISASGLLSWFIADSASNDAPTATSIAVRSDDTTAPTTAVGNDQAAPPVAADASASSAAIASLEGEPFARAAALIAPSVVQLTLPDGLGTGVIVNENGTILTAAHVVGNASQVEVRLFDGSTVEGTVAGTHEETDVAVVTIDPTGRDIVAARIADGDSVRVGQLAVAVGSPFGFEQTVTAGIISGIDRVVNNVSMVQTDAPINPGNSGGPLINLEGEVVGINDLIFTESGSSAGVGFAISIDLAVIVADQLIAGQDVQLALLGVTTTVPPDGSRGAFVQAISPGSAAEESGLEVGDVVVGVDGDSTRGSADLRAQVIDNAPGTTITLDVLRDGDSIRIEATLGSTG